MNGGLVAVPDKFRALSHLSILGRVDDKNLTKPGGGRFKVRPVGQRTDGTALLRETGRIFDDSVADRETSNISQQELRALGTFITIEGAEAIYPLKLDSLEQRTSARLPKPKWLLMSVQPATNTTPERAVVWVADAYRQSFLKLFEDYVTKMTPTGKPKNEALVANIASIRTTILRDLWQSDGEPPHHGKQWWELWLAEQNNEHSVLQTLSDLGFDTAQRVTVFQNRTIVWVNATWVELQILPFTAIPLAEIRRPSFVDSIEDLTTDEQAEWVNDLLNRIIPADEISPAVCHLDTGVARTHVLLADSLPPGSLQTVVGSTGFDTDGHGTMMAGIALFGNLDHVLLENDQITLRHQLESVRILPSKKRAEIPHDPLDYGTVTSQAVSTIEIAAAHRRVYCMPVTADPDKPGEPTLWSATVDALSVGTNVVRDGDHLRLMGVPEPGAARLIVISAGNTELPDDARNLHPLDISDSTGIADPAQAWNALTVGAFTDLDQAPIDPQFAGWRAIAPAGELSPHSRTSVPFSRPWPIKPDICLEGGNVLTDGSQIDRSHPSVSVRTTKMGNDYAITSANATSAATAAASRLAALAMAEYPEYWPETIRGLLVHAADWTTPMRDQIKAPGLNLTSRSALLRRYGWGVPTEDSVLHSSRQAVTMVVQDKFTPFDGSDYRMRHFRLHALPWPKRMLQAIGAGDVSMKITLSYFVEPNPSRRGWNRRYSYASHAFRFELKAPQEADDDFIIRVNRKASDEESGMPRPRGRNDRWLVGPKQRNTGSLHQDIWDGNGAELAPCDKVAVYPVGGWWKNNGRRDRVSLPLRYALFISLSTREQGIDLYTPIANELRIPTPVATPST